MGVGYRSRMLHEPRDMQLGGISLRVLQRLRVMHAAMVLVVAIAWVLMLAGLPFASWTSKAWLAAATLCALLGLGVVLHITFWRFTRAGAERLEPALRDQRVRRIGAHCRQRTAQCRGPQCRWSLCVCAQRVGSARLQRQSISA